MTTCNDATGQKFFTLAFVIADKRHEPAWDGRTAMAKNLFGEQVGAIRAAGGDVIASFGGEGGKELALVEMEPAALEAKYQVVIDQYHLTWLDFDIEGDALHDQAANDRRNIALAGLQQKNPTLSLSYTLPVDPEGIPKDGVALLISAKRQSVKIACVNVMTMDFGAQFAHGKKMSEVAIASVLKAHEQCQTVDPGLKIGITPMIGQNDEKQEIFTLEDAAVVERWAVGQAWVRILSFWSCNRDQATAGKDGENTSSGLKQEQWAFTRIFQRFASVQRSSAPATKD